MIKIYSPIFEKYPEVKKRDEEYLTSHLPKDVEFSIECLDDGYETIENEFHAAVNGAILIAKIQKGIEEDVKGIVIDCFDDPALEEIRDIVNVPVAGVGRTTLYAASTVSDKVGVITTDREGEIVLEKKLSSLGLERIVSSITSLNLSVEDLMVSEKNLLEKLVEAADEMIEQNGVDTICLGCTCFNYIADSFREEIRKKHKGIKVFEPMLNTVLIMDAMIKEKMDS